MYEKPMVIASEDLAEGVFMASGDCYTASAYIHQTPEVGRDSYVIQVNGKHSADHYNENQVLFLSFNQPVEYLSSNGELIGGNNTNTLQIQYSYHNNETDNIGLGDVYVKAGDGLAVTGCRISDSGFQLSR